MPYWHNKLQKLQITNLKMQKSNYLIAIVGLILSVGIIFLSSQLFIYKAESLNAEKKIQAQQTN